MTGKFSLGPNSLKELQGVHPELVKVVHKSVEYTTQDFGVHDGLRTLEEQKRLVASGASKTMNSMHRVQKDGFGHAVDLVPFINGKLRWEWDPIWKIALAVDEAATELGVELVWGAVWDKPLQAYGGSINLLKEEVEAYKKRHPGSDFLDGPHYQLSSKYRR